MAAGAGISSFWSASSVARLRKATCSARSTLRDSFLGDGALPEIPVNFIVLANGSTFVPDPGRLPDADWSGSDPITGATISGTDFFEATIDLLNQQLRADDGDPVCLGNDCLRLAYRSHTYYSPTMFETAAGDNVCPKLHAIARAA